MRATLYIISIFSILTITVSGANGQELSQARLAVEDMEYIEDVDVTETTRDTKIDKVAKKKDRKRPQPASEDRQSTDVLKQATMDSLADDRLNERGQYHSSVTENPDSTEQVVADSVVKKKGFLKKLVRYFDSSNVDKTYHKKIDVTFIGGPNYSSTTQFGAGMIAAGLFRLKNSHDIPTPSNISLFANVSTSGFFDVGVRGDVLINNAKQIINHNIIYSHFPLFFWGLGYEMGNEESNKAKYVENKMSVDIDFMQKIAKNFFMGVKTNITYIVGNKFTNTSLIEGQKSKSFNPGLGLTLTYDSRDSYTNAYSGILVKLEDIVYPSLFGNKGTYNRFEMTFNLFHKLWKGAILAYDLHGVYQTGDIPWTMMVMSGGKYRMRGYYQGRYRDKSIAEFQVELRQKIWRRIGVVAWGGVGNVFNKANEIKFSESLPNIGLGARWELKNRMNLRVDVGFGKSGMMGIMLSVGEAF